MSIAMCQDILMEGWFSNDMDLLSYSPSITSS